MDERINLTAVHPRTGIQGSSLQFVIRLKSGFRVGWLSAGRPFRSFDWRPYLVRNAPTSSHLAASGVEH